MSEDSSREITPSIYSTEGTSCLDVTSAEQNFLNAMTLLCLDGNDATGGGVMEREKEYEELRTLLDACHVEDAALEDDGHSTIDRSYLRMIDPRFCNWNAPNDVLSWLLLSMNAPMKLLRVFVDPAELGTFLIGLSVRANASYTIPLCTDSQKGWTIESFLMGLHANFFCEFKMFLYDNLDPHRVLHTRKISAGADGDDDRAENEQYISMHLLSDYVVPFDRRVYSKVLYSLGAVPFPNRVPYLMDLRELYVSSVTVCTAWTTWDFWFGAKAMLSSPPSRKVASAGTRTTCGRGLPQRIFEICMHLHDYLMWIRMRLYEIMSHPTSMPDDERLREMSYVIGSLVAELQSRVNLFAVCYLRDNERLGYRSDTLISFASHVYSSCTDSRAISDVPTPAQLKRAFSNVPLTTEGLVDDIRRIARMGTVSEDVMAKIESYLEPIHSKVQYQSRAISLGNTIDAAVQDTHPRSKQVNEGKFMEMIAGDTNKIQSNLPPRHLWALDCALQFQGIDTSLTQNGDSDFTWTDTYFMNDSEAIRKMIDSRKWPRVDSDGKARDLPWDDAFMSEGDGFPVKFDSPQAIVVVRFGCSFLLIGHGHVFCSLCPVEVFHAWSVLKEVYEGWKVEFDVERMTKDKVMRKITKTCDLRSGTRYIVEQRFQNAEYYGADLDEDLKKQLSRRVGTNASKNSEEDEEKLAKAIS
jgi:hypothetical protein